MRVHRISLPFDTDRSAKRTDDQERHIRHAVTALPPSMGRIRRQDLDDYTERAKVKRAALTPGVDVGRYGLRSGITA